MQANNMDTDRNDLFEVLGVYFANYYWNNLYNKALRAWSDEKFPNLESAYREILNRYTSGFCVETKSNERINENYVQVTQGIHMQYQAQSGDTCTYYEFVDIIVKCFVPKEFYKRISDYPKKANVFRTVLAKALTRFTIFVCKDQIHTVLDSKIREDAAKAVKNVKFWKQTYRIIIDEESKTFYHLCMAQCNGVKVRHDDSVRTISREVYERLQQKLQQVIQEKNEIIKERNQIAQLAITYRNMLSRTSSVSVPVSVPVPIRSESIRSEPVKSEEPEEPEELEEYELLEFLDTPDLKSDD